MLSLMANLEDFMLMLKDINGDLIYVRAKDILYVMVTVSGEIVVTCTNEGFFPLHGDTKIEELISSINNEDLRTESLLKSWGSSFKLSDLDEYKKNSEIVIRSVLAYDDEYPDDVSVSVEIDTSVNRLYIRSCFYLDGKPYNYYGTLEDFREWWRKHVL